MKGGCCTGKRVVVVIEQVPDNQINGKRSLQLGWTTRIKTRVMDDDA